MLNRWSVLTLIVGAIAGYGFGAPAARAQAEPMPFTLGDRVTLRYETTAEHAQDVTCVVGAFMGDWVRCDSTDKFNTPRYETWRSLKQVVRVTKYQK
jgi:hypothetical protein